MYKKKDQQHFDKLDEIEELEMIDEKAENDELERILNGYHTDDDTQLIDDNKTKNQNILSKQQSKKRHLTTQDSISDTEFFNQRFDGPGLKNLNKQESIIEEEESSYGANETKTMPSRVATTREVCFENVKL